MSAGEPSWSVRLTAAAEADFAGIIAWTVAQFGDVQARIYAETVSLAVEALTASPGLPSAKVRPEIGRHLLTLHVARRGRRGRHFILFRADSDPKRRRIEVLRILHEAMDLERHVPEDDA